jgi:hypothetical protein
VNTLHATHCHKLPTKARVIRINIKIYGFWDTCANFVHIVELVLVALKAFDGKQPCMGTKWLFMKRLKWHVLALWNPPFELSPSLANVIKEKFYYMWKMLTTNLHYTWAFLNPYLLGEVCLHDDANVKEAFYKKYLVVQQLCLSFKKLSKFYWKLKSY